MTISTSASTSSSSESQTDLEVLQSFLKEHPTVSFIRYRMTDYGNMSRVRVVTVSHTLETLATPGAFTGISSPSPVMYGLTNMNGLLMEHLLPGGDQWHPDWSTIKMAPEGRNLYATVTCSVHIGVEPEDPLAKDARHVLRELEKKAKEELGLTFKVGFEIEFTLLDSPDSLKELESPGASVWSGVPLRHKSWQAVEEAVTALLDADIKVWGFHSESGFQSYEISLSPTSPYVAADNLVFATDVIKTLAAKHGYHATMHPKFTDDVDTLGQHIHFSIDKPELNDPFLAGLLKHGKAAAAFLLGGYDSYGIRESNYGGGYVSWGPAKFSSFRQVGPGHWEARAADSLTNPYLQLAALLAGGIAGVRSQLPMTMKPLNSRNPKDVAEAGLTEKISKSLEGSLEALKADREPFDWALGKKCVDAYLVHKTGEIGHAAAMPIGKRRRMLVSEF